MKILGSTLVVFSTLLGVGVLYAQSTGCHLKKGKFMYAKDPWRHF